MSDLRGEEEEQSPEKRPPEQTADLGPGVTPANGVEAATGEPTAPQGEADTQTEVMDFREDDSPDQPNGTVKPSASEQVADKSASDLTLNLSPKEGTREGKLAGSGGGDGGAEQPNGSVEASAAAGEGGRKSEGKGEGGEGKEEEWIDVLGNGQLKKKVSGVLQAVS